MGKRKEKEIIASEDEDEAVATPSESEEEKPKFKENKITAKKPKFIHKDADDVSEEEQPVKKKVEKPASSKKPSVSAVKESTSGTLLKDSSGDQYIDLGKKKRATVRSFKGATLVDIREFYDAGGEEKPGKKGISLSPEQWEVLKNNVEIIDSLFSKIKKK